MIDKLRSLEKYKKIVLAAVTIAKHKRKNHKLKWDQEVVMINREIERTQRKVAEVELILTPKLKNQMMQIHKVTPQAISTVDLTTVKAT